VASYLSTACDLPVRLAREGEQEYFAGLLRLINSTALIHADFGPYDAPGWEIGGITAQLTWNILLREIQGGECIIYHRFWEGKSDDEQFKQPKPAYGYRAEVVEGREVQVVSPEVGELTIFNSRCVWLFFPLLYWGVDNRADLSRNFHAVNAAREPDLFPRYTMSSFIGLLPTPEGSFEMILWS